MWDCCSRALPLKAKVRYPRPSTVIGRRTRAMMKAPSGYWNMLHRPRNSCQACLTCDFPIQFSLCSPYKAFRTNHEETGLSGAVYKSMDMDQRKKGSRQSDRLHIFIIIIFLLPKTYIYKWLISIGDGNTLCSGNVDMRTTLGMEHDSLRPANAAMARC